MTQQEVALKVHVAITTYGDWERGKSKPRTLEMAVRVCQVLGISLDWYATGKGANLNLTAEETELINYFRSTPEERQKLFLDVAKTFSEAR